MLRALAFTLLVLLSGCAGVLPGGAEKDRAAVRTLGVLPLLVDEGSAIGHPERQGVVDLLYRHNVLKESRLTALLKERRKFFDIRPISGDPARLYARLVRERALAGEGPGQTWQYRFNPSAAAELAREGAAEALLVIVFNGIDRKEKRWDRTRLNFLEGEFNALLATAMVVLPSGEVVWESSGAPGKAFALLQYPDFDEAFYNLTDQVQVKFVTLAGLERALAEPERGVFARSPFPRRYGKLFEEIASELKPDRLVPQGGVR
ncbi:hypothetical protein [uncultured Desulfuromonas sp.]|uniref:hypothetical protein n=1 Tax=uncultured Desulfuromonas sp. TaxID=181013 RepID=UPI00263032B0|nr:hypothetical protein [uncultured Desulfuromonas sp.]